METDKNHNKNSTNGKESVKSEQSYTNLFGMRQPKAPLVFIIQTLLVFIVIISALVNLSINSLEEGDKKMWIILLSSCVGYILPNPSLKFPTITT